MSRLDGKIAIVTGAGGGIGRETALVLAARGARVVVAEIDPASGEETRRLIGPAGGEAVAIPVDIADEASVEALVAATVRHFGGLDVLVNNAAAGHPDDIDIASMKAEVWERISRVNSLGPMLMCKHAIPHLVRRGGGSIVNISSGGGVSGQLSMPAYNAAKASVLSLTQSVATMHGRDSIRCNAITPGFIVHGRLKGPGSEEFRRMIGQHVLLAEEGNPSHIATTVAFLASDDARFITGQVIPVDGGLLMHTPLFAELGGKTFQAPSMQQSA
jgi:NAD(P)-dependent dehydrogenase (short-subunit alcohol dehydrogenase family)